MNISITQAYHSDSNLTTSLLFYNGVEVDLVGLFLQLRNHLGKDEIQYSFNPDALDIKLGGDQVLRVYKGYRGQYMMVTRCL